MLNGHDIAGVNGAGIITRALTGDFTICKATEGRGWRDPLHDTFTALLRQGGKLVGHYHYAWPENGGRADAVNFLAMAKAQPGDVLALDFEPFRTKAHVASWGAYIVEFAQAVRDALGVWPWLYSEDYHLRLLTGLGEFPWIRDTLPLWKAGVNNAYVSHPSKGPGSTYGFTRVVCFQWSATGIDQDVFYGDRVLWASLAVGGSPAPRPVPSLVGTGVDVLEQAAAVAVAGHA